MSAIQRKSKIQEQAKDFHYVRCETRKPKNYTEIFQKNNLHIHTNCTTIFPPLLEPPHRTVLDEITTVNWSYTGLVGSWD